MTHAPVSRGELAPPEQKTRKDKKVQNNNSNPKPETVEAVRAHVALRVDLLASCARDIKRSDNTVSRWARAELGAIRSGLTDVEAVQLAVCEKFPKLTANGKPSKTPNSSFKTSFDKFVLLAEVMGGTHKTYASDAASAIVDAFLAEGSAMTLNDAVDQIKAGHAAGVRAKLAAETDEQKAARKAAEEEQLIQQFAGTVSASPAMLNALAKRIEAFGVEEAPLAEALANVREAIGGFAERLAASEQKLAA